MATLTEETRGLLNLLIDCYREHAEFKELTVETLFSNYPVFEFGCPTFKHEGVTWDIYNIFSSTGMNMFTFKTVVRAELSKNN